MSKGGGKVRIKVIGDDRAVDGKIVKDGETVEATPGAASTLCGIGHAELVTDAAPKPSQKKT